MEGKGCVDCNNTGYKAGAACNEVFRYLRKIRDQISTVIHSEIKKSAVTDGMLTLRSER